MAKKEVHIKQLSIEGIKFGSVAICGEFVYISIVGQNKIVCWNPIAEEDIKSCKTKDIILQKQFPILDVYDEKIFCYFFGEGVLYKNLISSTEIEKLDIPEDQSVFLIKK